MIRVENLSKIYPGSDIKAVDSVSFGVKPGELVVLLGESGSGKSTTLKMINRLIEPTDGTITVDGQDVRQMDPVMLRRQIGYVFQEIGLFPHMTVAENIAIVPRLMNWPEREIEERIDELLSLLNLDSSQIRNRFPAQLSGGQRQRIGVARAMAARPGLMLMDEPFGALDPITRDSLQEEFKKLQRSLNLTVLMVTHDITEALLLADRIAIMKDGQLLELAPPEQLLRGSEHPYVQKLMEMPLRHSRQVAKLTQKENGSSD